MTKQAIELPARLSLPGYGGQDVKLRVSGQYFSKGWRAEEPYSEFEWETVEVYDAAKGTYSPLPFAIGNDLAQAITDAATEAYEANAGP